MATEGTADTDQRLTEEEAEQYDRQIRLWGLEAQKRLRASRILMVGMRGLAAEVCKNVVLAGVKSLTVIDHRPLVEQDCATRFLCFKLGENRAQTAVPRLQILNPNVTVVADTDNVEEKPEEFFRQFDVICATCCSLKFLLRLSNLCHDSNIKFFCGDVWGYYGYFFTDLGEHTYAIEVSKKVQEEIMVEEMSFKRRKLQDGGMDGETVTEKKICSFESLESCLSLSDSKKTLKYYRRTPLTFFVIQTLQLFRDEEGRDPGPLDQKRLLELKDEVTKRHDLPSEVAQRVDDEFMSHCMSELSPACAIVGGVLAQEIIKAISANSIPLHNMFLFDGVKSSGIVESFP